MWSSKHEINDMHVSIVKPQCSYAKDYHDHKTDGHNILTQSIVDRSGCIVGWSICGQQMQWCWVMITLFIQLKNKTKIWRYIMKGGN